MIIKKPQFTKKRKILLVVAVLLVLGSIIFGYIYMNRKSDSQKSNPGINSINYGNATDEQKKSGNEIKYDSLTGKKSDQPPQPTSIPGSTKKNIQVIITSANQNEGVLQIRALIGAAVNTGTCSLTLSKRGSATITKTASVQPQATVSTCKGFDIPLSSLSSGEWTVNLVYDSQTLTGSTTKLIVVE